MSKASIKLRRKGETIWVQTGRYREPFDATFLDRDQIVERVYYSLLTGGVRLSKDTILNMLTDEGVI